MSSARKISQAYEFWGNKFTKASNLVNVWLIFCLRPFFYLQQPPLYAGFSSGVINYGSVPRQDPNLKAHNTTLIGDPKDKQMTSYGKDILIFGIRIMQIRRMGYAYCWKLLT